MLDFAKKNPKQIINAVPLLAKRERSFDCLEEMKGKDFIRTKKGVVRISSKANIGQYTLIP